ncbi:hypothetical protein [Streptomyces sp. NPDC054784]
MTTPLPHRPPRIAALDVPAAQVAAEALALLAARLPVADPDRHDLDPTDTAWAALAPGHPNPAPGGAA